jgi:hypothetical protein
VKQVLIRGGKVFVEEVPAPASAPRCALVRVSHSLISSGTESTLVSEGGTSSYLMKKMKDPLNVEKVKRKLASIGIRGTIDLIRSKLTEFQAPGYSTAGMIVECGEVSGCQKDVFVDTDGSTMLKSIQSDILNLRERKSTGALPFPEADDSLQVHSCHSPLREIEVLQDSLLTLFDDNPHVRLDDVLVMIPDIELYAPFIQAVFSIPPDDSRWLPFTIADRSLLQESGFIDTFLRLLDLAGSRFGVSGVLDLLETDAVRAKFALAEEDLALIHHWIRETGIRWGIDAESKEIKSGSFWSS